ncbi:MAG: zinc ABC transporter substrate-binding protein [Ilumatobacteraceae bacterium]
MKLRRLLRALPLAIVLPALTVGCGDDSSSTPAGGTTASGPKVVASTTWTGAYAKLAGATDITVIAPTSILHPPDYDPKPSDLLAAADADIVVFAEFESFAPRLTEAAGGDVTTFPLTLENTVASIESEVMRLAAELGTEAVARTNLDTFLAAAKELGADAATHVGEAAPVIVSQVFMSYWADWAGLTSAGTFGPQPMSAGDLADLTALSPTLIVDNYHVPGGQAFEAEGTPRIELINYPGDDLDLLAVFQHNHDLFVKALDGEIEANTDITVPEGGGHGHGETTHGETATTVGGHGHGEAETTVAAHGHGETATTGG